MPWKKSELMDQRREFALKALGTLNFGALCQEYGVWNQPQDGLQMARKAFTPRTRRDGGRFAAAAQQSQAIERRTGVRNGEAQAGASTLGTAQDSDVVPTAPRAGAKREQF